MSFKSFLVFVLFWASGSVISALVCLALGLRINAGFFVGIAMSFALSLNTWPWATHAEMRRDLNERLGRWKWRE